MTTISKTELSVNGFDIPLKVKSSNKKNSIRFNLISPETGNKLERKYRDPETGELYDSKECDKGYKIDGEIHRIGSRDEVKEFKKTLWSDGMELADVIGDEEFSKMIQNGHNWLAPNDSDDAPEDSMKRYKLLQEVLKDSERVVLVEFASRSRPRLYGIRYNSEKKRLEIRQVAYPDTVKEPEFDIDEEVSEDKVNKIGKLLDKVKEEKSDSELVDNYREKVEQMVEDVVIEGEELDVETEKEEKKEQNLEEELDQLVG